MTKYKSCGLIFLIAVILTAIVFASCNKNGGGSEKTDAENNSGADKSASESSSESSDTVPMETLHAAVSIPRESDGSESQQPNDVTTPAESDAITDPGDPSAFDRSLFIGDSRTVGLSQYADLGGADIFATTGLNIFRLKNETVNVRGHGCVSLDSLLTREKYERVYIMLGINEIGYDHSFVIRKYGEVLNHLKEISPESIFVLCANLHIIQKRSQNDAVYNNVGINELNEGIKRLANECGAVYLDVNPLFDDENGALNEAYTVDDFHLIGKYYEQWGQWLSAQCLNK